MIEPIEEENTKTNSCKTDQTKLILNYVYVNVHF
jgi:hypothetical protein